MFRVECDADVALVGLLTSTSKRRIMHHQGKNELLRKLLKQNDSVGMIDKDPWSIQPTTYLQRFQVLSYSDTDGIEILHHTQGHNRLVIIYPRLEEWIIESARRVNVSLKHYNLPTNGNDLHEEINFKIKRFEELVDHLKKDSDRVKALKARLTEPF
jgi:hypothetical protein